MGSLYDLLKRETALPDRDLQKIIATAPARYKTYKIPKRNSEKMRVISQPAKEVKLMQRVLMREFLSNFPIHKAATAYKSGSSIRDNAAAHVGRGPILKFDFKDFFPSITENDWRKYAEGRGIAELDIEISTKIFFKKEFNRSLLRLSIGAPSSPILSNILMFGIDERISAEIASDEVSYTRYADDITFSAPRTGYFNGLERHLRMILREIEYPALKINSEKTVYATSKFRRQVTGLVLTNDGQISVGRDRKRNLFAAVHHALNGRLNDEQIEEVLGLIAFVSSIEHDFKDRLEKKYGPEVVRRLYRCKQN
ncbi:retron St85 family RNA-directed DNA polymerase [Citromicrobium bathyomarinum]|uniref:retron St85 family RNA-directed DNA polymerase n=1 Tax=Citromicrobium bathyomarinum TaxID=72174 RepID=UPI001E45563D|nr:retron St85 family RNA-directed DNA polymerase [Citromicrobium bathyomarinum]MCD1621694.1 retron St85 family RNA-directed DNA polymerase [Citromicrobium bathyomarinum]